MKPIELPQEAVSTHTDAPAISVKNLGKCYQLYTQPHDRLKQFLWRGRRQYFREFWALRDVSFEIAKGEVLGIVGRNGSGKSTLLQLVCGTLTPTLGEVSVRGRVAALLELGAGFNPEFSGRENVFMSAAIMGLSSKEIEARFEEIVDFSGIRDFIDQPVKTYSSGMYVRLAFSVAINVDPDILVIDEALSVGDGAFARKSFERIMALKDAGRTILFCSHSLYQVEAICNRVVWLDQGGIVLYGEPARVIPAYNTDLMREEGEANAKLDDNNIPPSTTTSGIGRILNIVASVDGLSDTNLMVRSGKSNLAVTIDFVIDLALPPPTLAVRISNSNQLTVSSAISCNDGANFPVGADGRGQGTIVFHRLPLLKGNYSLTAFLACERAIHPYDIVENAILFEVTQEGLEQGFVSLPHEWIS